MTTDEMDREANYFAICLLIPEHMIREDMLELYPKGIDLIDGRDIEFLSKRYGVSEQVMLIRLVELGLSF